MSSRVAVTRVTIEYVSGGRPFTIVFNEPESIDAIVLNRQDLDRFQEKQNELAAKPNSNVPRVREHIFDPRAEGPQLSLKQNTHPPLPVSIESGTGATNADPVALSSSRSLWWHGSNCAWFHPEGDN